MKRRAIWAVAMGLLAGCGGGGGGGGSSWLSFKPNPVQVDMYEGESPMVYLTGTASGAPHENVSIGVFADGTLFTPGSIGLSTSGEDDYSGRVHGRLLPTLGVGTHEGYFEVRACKDYPTVCAQPYGGSPWHIPVIVRVAADPGNPTSPANGDFSQGLTGWEHSVGSGAVATFTVSDGELHVAISNAGPDAYGVGLAYAAGIDLEAGHQYRLAFDARGDAPRTITGWVDGGLPRDHGTYGEMYTDPPPTFALDTALQSFHVDFTMRMTNRAAGIYFALGGSTADVYLSNVTVTDLSR